MMSPVEVDENAVLLAIGNSVLSRRTQAGLSQVELAQRVGIDRSFLSGIERGKRNPTIVTLTRLAAALDTSAAELVGTA
jgi:transcriptional regulator with XRE-family HTH domain